MQQDVVVAVTGLGAISPYGVGVDALLGGLSSNRSGLNPLSVFPSPLADIPVVGQVTALHESGSLAGRLLSRADRLALSAGREASASLIARPDLRAACAVVIATTVSGLAELPAAIVTDPVAYFRQGGTSTAST